MKNIFFAVVVTLLAGCSSMSSMGFGSDSGRSNITGANTDVNDHTFRPYHN